MPEDMKFYCQITRQMVQKLPFYLIVRYNYLSIHDMIKANCVTVIKKLLPLKINITLQ